MIYVFLDVDGVFNGGYQHESKCFDNDKIYNNPFSKNMGDYYLKSKLDNFRTIIKNYKVSIIIVSSWADADLVESDHKIRLAKKQLNLPIIGSGYDTGGGLHRGYEVLRYVKEKNINKYIIVDDAKEYMYDPTKFDYSKHIWPCGRYGLQDCDFENLEKLLIQYTGEQNE